MIRDDLTILKGTNLQIILKFRTKLQIREFVASGFAIIMCIETTYERRISNLKTWDKLKQKTYSLQVRFFAFSLLLAIIPIVIIVGVSYNQYRQALKTRVSETNFNTVKQKADNIDFILSDVKTSSLFLLQNHDLLRGLRRTAAEGGADPGNRLTSEQVVREFIYYQQYIYSIHLRAVNGIEFDSAFATNPIDETVYDGLEYNEYSLDFNTLIDYSHRNLNVFSINTIIYDIRDFSTELARIKINIPEEDVAGIYNDTTFVTKGNYYIINPSGTIVSSTDLDSVGETLGTVMNYSAGNIEEKFQNQEGYIDLNIDREEWHITWNELMFPGWVLINTVSFTDLYEDYALIETVTVAAVLVSLLICVFFIIFFTVKVLGPLKKLRGAMSEIGEQNFKISLPVEGKDEISELARHFNIMSAQLDGLINEIYTGQIKQREAELRALQAQINPHFLYNTLDTIYWMCRLDGSVEAAGLVQSLSRLFRLSLNSGNEVTTVRREVELLQNYIDIQKKRYENSINFSISVDDELLDCQTVKLVLQPLVENAIIHGIEEGDGQGEIRVNIQREDDKLVYRIKDDGAGVDVDEINHLLKEVGKDNRGFGISSVHERIRLNFGEQYGIEFVSEQEHGTEVIVRQPYKPGGLA
jgi:two-component system sensor histidine kinase YesM